MESTGRDRFLALLFGSTGIVLLLLVLFGRIADLSHTAGPLDVVVPFVQMAGGAVLLLVAGVLCGRMDAGRTR